MTRFISASHRIFSHGPRAVLRRLKVKELARRVFRMAGWVFLRLPGSRRGARLVYAIAPRPAEWFAVRYRAYEQGAVDRRARSAAHSAAALAERSANLSRQRLDEALSEVAGTLSEEELRVCRQFIAGRSARGMTN